MMNVKVKPSPLRITKTPITFRGTPSHDELGMRA